MIISMVQSTPYMLSVGPFVLFDGFNQVVHDQSVAVIVFGSAVSGLLIPCEETGTQACLERPGDQEESGRSFTDFMKPFSISIDSLAAVDHEPETRGLAVGPRRCEEK